MHVLEVAPLLPYPPNHGWRVRTWHLLRGLAGRADVTLLTWAPPGTPEGDVEAVRSVVGELVCLPLRDAPRGLADRARRQARFLRGGPPPYVQELLEERGLAGDGAGAAGGAGAAVAGIHRERPFDLVVFQEEALRGMPLPALGAPAAVHRLEAFGRALAEVRAASAFGRAYHRLDGRHWARFDREVGEGVALVVHTSPQTMEELAGCAPGAATAVVPNGVALRSLRTDPAEGTDLAFIGTMDYPPNVDGAVWFVRELWPGIRRRHPGCRFRLVGRNPAPAVRDLAGDGVVVTGEVADVAEACEGVRAGIVPLRSGMGIKNKTLDFMSMGLPVVTLPAGAEGIAATAADGMDVVPGGAELVARATALLADGAEAARLGRAARDYVARHHDWDEIGARYHRALEAAVAEARQ